MTDFMNAIDKEYINSLFPAYLLKQPIGYDLLNCYYFNKKLFHKLHEKRLLESKIGQGDILNDLTPNTTTNINKINLNGFHIMYKNGKISDQVLSADLKKDIWSNLMSLGVLGTIPFDSVNDEYLIQIYQYFYPNDVRMAYNSNNNINNNDNTNGPNNQSLPSTLPDFITTDIYSTIGYTLPTRWLSQPNDCLIVSNDHFSKLSVNPNWERPLLLGSKATTSSLSYNRNRLRNADTNISGHNNSNSNNNNIQEGRNRSWSSISDYIMTWSNNYIPASKMAIFYYEIKVLEVSSTEHGKNCNIIVGFKYSNYPNNNNNNSVMIGSTNFNNNDNGNIYEELNPPFIGGSSTRSGHTIRNRNRERRRRRNRLRQSQSGRRRMSSTTIDLNISPGETNVNRDTSISGNSHGNENDTDDDDVNMSDNNNNDNDNDSNSMSDDDDEDNNYSDDDLDITTTAHHHNGRANLETNDSFTISNGKQFYGIDDTFFGYHGFDGKAFSVLESEPFAKPFGINDVIGCGINYINGTIFFTKNGNLLGTAFSEFHDINLIPAIALKAGNSIQTNFGLFEEFTFDILGYQNKWKQRAYDHIFNSIEVNHDYSIISENDSNINDTDMNQDELPFLLGKDKRISEKDGSMYKIQPNYVPINKLNPADESIPSALNCLINGYLIHEGLIDVAKGFLKDLKDEIEMEVELKKQSETSSNNNNNNNSNNNFNIGIQKQILKYNEGQIFKEEKMLRIRQELRKLIYSREIDKCINYIKIQIPGFLESNIETLFELKLVKFLINIETNSSNVEELIHEGQSLIEEFVYQTHEDTSDTNIEINKELKEMFQSRINAAASLLAYNAPLVEAPEDLLVMLSREFIQDRLFLILNSNILLYLNETDECALENIIGYTRTMFSTMRQYHLEGDQSYNIDPDLGFQMPQDHEHSKKEKKNGMDTIEKDVESVENGTCLETRYYKIINLDEDILNMN